MQEWLPAVIAAVAAISGVLLGWTGRTREAKQSIRTDSREEAAMRADVEYIKRGVDDIRVEQRAMRQDMSDLTERVTRVEESSKQAHKRIDRVEQRDGQA